MRERSHRIRTALVEGVACTVSEGVWTRGQRDPSDHAEPLNPLQEGRVRQLLVGRDLPPVGRPDRLAEDGDIGHLRLQRQGQLLIARRDIQLADPLGQRETRGQERIVGKDKAHQSSTLKNILNGMDLRLCFDLFWPDHQHQKYFGLRLEIRFARTSASQRPPNSCARVGYRILLYSQH